MSGSAASVGRGGPRQAADVALSTVLAFIEEEPGAFDTVTFVLFSPKDLQLFETTLAALTDTGRADSIRVTR
ncbi:MAG: hypothetical protein H6734_15090 [Alphaproteobacteria bacterium]|nr:hypothetical protein [Alphaproteobacteria bacterium]